MQPSTRISTLNTEGSDGWEVFYRARQRATAGEPIVELTIGEHDVSTDPSILAAMDASARGGHTGYALVPGTHALRQAVATRVTERTGVSTTPDNVMITPGGQSALFAAHMAACDPGDRALFITPYYATYPGTIRAAGAEPVAIAARSEDAFQPRPSDIDAQAANAKSLLINSPNNPTGGVYTHATLEGIAHLCQTHDLWLISDEVYDTQVWDGAHLSPRSLPGMAERTMVIGSMSKSHAMTGSRVGWIVAPEEIIAHLIGLATNTTYGVPGFVQDAALFALGAGPELEEKIAGPFRRRRDLALRILEQQNILRAQPPSGAMYLMLDVRATGLTCRDFANQLLDETLVAVMPGESFGPAAQGHIRVAMTVGDAAFEEALSKVIAFAKAQVAKGCA